MHGQVNISLVGVNHLTAGVAVRERVAIAPRDLPSCLLAAAACEGVGEALLLSTCNRSELYLVAANGCCAAGAAHVYSLVHQLSPEQLCGHTYTLQDAEAVAHMFKVAAGAESMVVGETEIMGQLRRAVEAARAAGTAGRVLSRLGDTALAVGKRARTETAVDRGCVSVASVAVRLALQVFDELASRRVLIVGAGELGALVARRMVDCGAGDVTITTRTLSRAEALAGDIGGRAVPFDRLVDELLKADIVVTSTGSSTPLVSVERVEAAAGRGRRRPTLLIDLAVPRDVDPAVRAIDDVYLYDLDDLQRLVQDVEGRRCCELPLVEAIAEEEARRFMLWAKSQQVTPLVLQLRRQADAIRAEEIGRLLATTPDLTGKTERAVHLMSKRLVRRLLQGPLERLRLLAAEGLSESDLSLIEELFTLPDEAEEEEEPTDG